MNIADTLPTRTLKSLLKGIVKGRYGDTLPPQEALSLELGVSRTVLREAIVILSFCNVLSVQRKVGTKINARETWKPVILELVEGKK
jgi:DNA-binding FadR family transcriptional regulator